jgi:tRNA(Arg) A34 adenosine deaminase TadA
MDFPGVTMALPFWVADFVETHPRIFPSREDRMAFVVALSRNNILHKTGGPFGAAVFHASGRLVAPGVNLVLTANCSIFHAEMVAIGIAQKILSRYDLSNNGADSFELYASTEPCAMCFGAIPWSGVNRLVCGARDEDARRIGFDEGPKLRDWVKALSIRHIEVMQDVLRPEAVAVLHEYAASGGVIYNSGPM